MASEKFIMVSLEDKKSKELANVISNGTSRKILDFLSDSDATESDIAKALKIPQSTVHYNVKHLLEQDLVEAKDFYWSEKGNKVNIYTVAQKLIVIAPKKAKIPASLKGMLPVVLFVTAAAGLIDLWNKLSGNSLDVMMQSAEKAVSDSSTGGADFMRAAAEPVAERVMEASAGIAATSADNMAKEVVNETIARAAEEVPEVVAPEVTQVVVNMPNVAVWFFGGAIFALLLYLIWNRLLNKKM